MNKKALSDVISTVLLILIVLILIALLWFFVRPLIFKSTDDVKDSGSCLTVRFSPVECSYTRSDAGNSTGGGRHSLVLIRRDGDTAPDSRFALVFTDDNDANKVIQSSQTKFETNKSLGPGEAKTYIVEIDSFIPKTLAIAAVVGKSICAPLATPIECKPYTGPTPCADVISKNDTLVIVNATTNYTDGSYLWISDRFINGIDKDGFDEFYEKYTMGLYYSDHLDFNKDTVINLQDYEVFTDAFNLGGSPKTPGGAGNTNCPEGTG